jgi:hypothetical protein
VKFSGSDRTVLDCVKLCRRMTGVRITHIGGPTVLLEVEWLPIGSPVAI